MSEFWEEVQADATPNVVAGCCRVTEAVRRPSKPKTGAVI